MAEGDLGRLPLSRLSAQGLGVTPPGAGEPSIGDVSLAIEPGEWVGITGPNGSGKTSLIYGLGGLWPATGELRLEGIPFGPGSEPGIRQGVAVIQQDPSSQLLQPTLYDELAFAPRNLGVAEDEIRSRVDKYRERLGLVEEMGREPGRLSAGRQQMALIAAALVASPDLLLADEATAHMDLGNRHRVLELLRAEAGRGLSIVWVTQTQEELAAVDRVIELGPIALPPPPLGEEPAAIGSGGRLKVLVSPLDRAPTEPTPVVRTDRAVELEVGSSGIIAVVGPNGVGKSVLLAAIAGLEPNRQITTEWMETPEPPPIAALQFPELQIFEEQVSDEIAYASVMRGRSREESLAEASKWLQALAFDPERFLEQRTWSLAMGAKRVMEVVAALIAPASVILLDEPTAGLDADRRARLGRVLSEIALRRPIVVATQDREWLSAFHIRGIEIAPSTAPKPPS